MSDEVQPPDAIEPRKADAIHRALLTGLLSNVGFRSSETHEFTGARNTKFSIFPGSTLFRKRPAWVMSAERVETTKVYARTNAAVRPEWIERAADHLVHRTYTEPHWQRQTAHVVAFEKVTLFGMVLVPRRLVHFGPIDPVVSRRIFVESALVDGDFRRDAEWYKHNRDLIRHVGTLEAKARRQDLLADVSAKFAFYESRVPPDVYNGPLFDKWRTHEERGRPTLLFMHLRDLLKRNADDITVDLYPDTIEIGDRGEILEAGERSTPSPLYSRERAGERVFSQPHDREGDAQPNKMHPLPTPLPEYREREFGARESRRTSTMTLPLTYLYEPGHAADGITVGVPLAGLNQLREGDFQWLIPGWREEKILALIRSLPKALRTNFIPAPEHAANAMKAIKAGDGSLHEALAMYLGKISGADVRPSSFDLSAVPEHLLMRFEVIDPAGKSIAAGRDLAEIRRQLGAAAQDNLGKILNHPWVRSDITSWDFGDLPDRVEIERHGMTLHAYPSLAEEKGKVSLRLFESPASAAAANRAGVRRLFLMQLGPDAKNLSRHVRNLEQASVVYTTLGPADELRDDVLTAAAERALYSEGGDVRTREAFVAHAQSGWRKLLSAANEITEIVLQTLSEHSAILKLMDQPSAPAWRDAMVDIRRQLAELLPRRFVMKTPPAWLEHLPRFMKAIRVRLEKLRDSGFNRDLAGLVQIGPMFQQYLERRAEHARSGVVDPELDKYRWMLEELRVSLFAQELKTSMPISVQRLDRQWALVRD